MAPGKKRAGAKKRKVDSDDGGGLDQPMIAPGVKAEQKEAVQGQEDESYPLTSKISDLKKQNKDLEVSLHKTIAENASLKTELASLKSKLDFLTSKHNHLKRELASTVEELGSVTSMKDQQTKNNSWHVKQVDIYKRKAERAKAVRNKSLPVDVRAVMAHSDKVLDANMVLAAKEKTWKEEEQILKDDIKNLKAQVVALKNADL
ncbi:hypothetical protein Tdes44962_MAKER06523 [Teratosphaeria destructans]|uniref:Uncharacterized protein n=1 Tax=Teratosphaeria destructans TaxID=418781 RepID=A0A9W7T1S8_9PEZI|nr:hypothetical protein Tdes44962_MAKER06523 [Teratosphaeria destructans]